MNITDLILGILGFLLTLAVFSYLTGDNPFFRAALYLLVGVGSGYAAAILVLKVLIPYLVTPLRQAGSPAFYLSLPPLILVGLLLFALFPRKHQWAKLPLAFLIGVVAAITLIGLLRGTLAPQLVAVVAPFSQASVSAAGPDGWSSFLEALVGLFGLIAVLFIFHHRQSLKSGAYFRSATVEALATIGQVFLGIALAALFVGLYATTLTALIARMEGLGQFFSVLFGR